MKFKSLKWQILHGSIARRVLFRLFLLALTIAMFPIIEFSRDLLPANLFTVKSESGCVFDFASNAFAYLKPMSTYAFPPLPSYINPPCKKRENSTLHLFNDLMNDNILKSGAKALCFGEGSADAVSSLRELGFSNAIGMTRRSFFSFTRKDFGHELEFGDNSFDFVFSTDVTRVYVPALLVLEIERVLKPGGIGAMLVAEPAPAHGWNPGSLIKSATPISSFLKCSDVVNVRRVGSLSLVSFKKKDDFVNPFEQYRLPDECPSIVSNKRFLQHLEPLADDNSVGIEDRFSFLPKFMNVSSKKRFIYVDIGSGEVKNSNLTNWFFKLYPLEWKNFDIYVVDHDTSVLSSYVKTPGVTFVYHPGLAENDLSDGSEPSEYDEGFDFLVWFTETVAAGDFVVLKMNAVGVELELLHDLFGSGAICMVDELFLRCPSSIDGPGNKHTNCVDIFKGLRSSGVYVHQWVED